MSSPKVLAFVEVPVKEARASNERDCRTFLAMARILYEDITARIAEMKSYGVTCAPPGVMAPEQAESETWRRFAGVSEHAVTFSHAYWQSLKHPHADRIVREYSAWKSGMEAIGKALSEAARDAIVSACDELFKKEEAAATLQGSAGRELVAAAPLSQNKARLEAEQELMQSIIKGAESAEEATSLKEEIQALLVNAPESQRVLKLELLRTDMAEQRTQRLRRAALERFDQETRLQYQGQLKVQSAALVESFALLSQEQEEHFTARLKELEQVAPSRSVPSSEAAFDALQAEVDQAVQRKSILAVVKKVLRTEGYDSVEEMETVTPQGIRASYFQDPASPGRWVEVAFKEESGLLSVELVKGEEDESATAAQKDEEAQKKLCKSISQAEVQLGTAYAANLKQEIAPGAKVKVKSSIKQRYQQKIAAPKQAERSV